MVGVEVEERVHGCSNERRHVIELHAAVNKSRVLRPDLIPIKVLYLLRCSKFSS